MKLSRAMAEASARIGHDFARPELLVQALTHPSTPGANHYQRLEFLGDRVLGLVVAEALIAADRDAAEGDLAPRLNALVRRETCADVAQSIELGAALRLGRSESLSGGRRKVAVLADAMEAVIAAVYLDAGLDAARETVLRLWGDRVAGSVRQGPDAKTALQEWAQARGLSAPTYADLAREGPDHAPLFHVEARLSDGRAAQGAASSKRAAQQKAAEALLASAKEAE